MKKHNYLLNKHSIKVLESGDNPIPLNMISWHQF